MFMLLLANGRALDLLGQGSIKAGRIYIATTLRTGDLHTAMLTTDKKVHWAPQTTGGKGQPMTSEPDPNEHTKTHISKYSNS